jgi:hypothetical protein
VRSPRIWFSFDFRFFPSFFLLNGVLFQENHSSLSSAWAPGQFFYALACIRENTLSDYSDIRELSRHAPGTRHTKSTRTQAQNTSFTSIQFIIWIV